MGCRVVAQGLLVLAAGLALARPARADEPPSSAPAPAPAPPRHGRGAWRAFRAGAALADSVPTVAIIEGAWSISGQVTTQLVSRAWDAPYPWGTIGHYTTRILYGTSWTLMLGIESTIVVALSGAKFDWMGEASYRSDWVMPVDLPACPTPGAHGGCGVGVGTFSFLQVRPRGSRWWYEAGGGWQQQRVLNDEYRTVTESSWVLTPISAVREIRTDPNDPVALRLFAGPGVYFGMHAAHMHPTKRGQDVYPNVPWTQMYPLEAGIGPGARIEARLIFAQHYGLEGEIVASPFLAGGPTKHVSADVAPLDYDRHGLSVWRKVGVGVAWEDPHVVPFKATLAFFGSELSTRPLDRLGYRGGMLRFDIPLRVPQDD